MYGYVPTLPSPGASINVDAALVVAGNADLDEAVRVSALAHLCSGGRAAADAIPRLVPLLNEPLLWLGNEALMTIAALARTVKREPLLGVDRHGLVIAGPWLDETTARDDMGQPVDDDGRPFAFVEHAATLLPRLNVPAPWAFVPPDGRAYLRVVNQGRATLTYVDAHKKIEVAKDDTVTWNGHEVRCKPSMFVNFRLNGVVFGRFVTLGPGDTLTGAGMEANLVLTVPGPPPGRALQLRYGPAVCVGCAHALTPVRHVVHLGDGVAIVDIERGEATRFSFDQAHGMDLVSALVDDPRPPRRHPLEG